MEASVMANMRLDKFLSSAGIGTRSEVKELMRKGEVTVNGSGCKKPEQKIDPACDTILVSGKQVFYEEVSYFLLHKPAGCISATTDEREKTVMDYLNEPQCRDLFPVGRLDKDTEGLLLLTNDGDLAHKLLSPKKHVDKTYYAKIEGYVDQTDIKLFLEGIDIGDEKKTLPAKLVILNAGEISEVEITIQEGRYHQIKRMFEAVGKKVVYLKRIAMGPLILEESLKKGSYRRLSKEEIIGLKKGR